MTDRRAGLPWRERVILWDRALAAVRALLRGRGLAEVSTPVRVNAVAVEPFIEPIAAPPGLLQTSPELAMKRLLCRGSGSIFQVSHVFRRAERGARHSEEFHLVEWYRVDAPLEAVQDDVEAVIAAVFDALGAAPLPAFDRRDLLDLVAETAGLELRGDEPAERLSAGAASIGLEVVDPGLAVGRDAPEIGGEGDRRGCDDPAAVRDLAAWSSFFSSWSDRHLDPWLVDRGRRGIHLGGFPPALAALAALRDAGRGDGSRLAERFESHVGGVELANGYHELRDPAEQRRRFTVVNGLRRAHGLEPLPIDDDFLADLGGLGLPACSGVALGLDRLMMVAVGATRLADVSLALGAPDVNRLGPRRPGRPICGSPGPVARFRAEASAASPSSGFEGPRARVVATRPDRDRCCRGAGDRPPPTAATRPRRRGGGTLGLRSGDRRRGGSTGGVPGLVRGWGTWPQCVLRSRTISVHWRSPCVRFSSASP
ncbi:MAG: amino acid--tRNA ligase-related protein [Nannocystaceae bacterium]